MVNLFTPAEVTANYANAGKAKAAKHPFQLLLLGKLAGFLIAMGGAVANTAVFDIANPGIAKLVAGLIFPFGLAIVLLTAAELYTGDILMSLSLKESLISFPRMLLHWLIVYVGNAIGAVAVAAGCAFYGQMDLGKSHLAAYTIKVAAAKSSMPWDNALVLGIFCNVLVTIAVLVSMAGKDLIGRAAGAYMPVAFFVIAGFEHSIANLYYGPAGLFARHVDRYAAAAKEMGVDLSSLTWGRFLLHNLLPVTIGNTIGGLIVGAIFWWSHIYVARDRRPTSPTTR